MTSHRQREDFELVADALEMDRGESLAAAALRVFRRNCAPKPTLDVARIVLEARHGASADEQWRAIHRAARALRAARAN